MNIGEKGSRAVYAATKKGTKGTKGNNIQALVYRESYSGRVAAMYHNNLRLFGANRYTIVPQDRFRNACRDYDIEEAQIVHEDDFSYRNGSQSVFEADKESGRLLVLNHLRWITRLTYYQSEDPLWFILRAFAFTSRTAQSFLRFITSNYSNNLYGLAFALRGRQISHLSCSFPEDLDAANAFLKKKFDALRASIGFTKGDSGSVPISAEEKVAIIGLSNDEITSMLKDDVIKILRSAGINSPSRLRVGQLKDLLRNERDKLRQESSTTHLNENVDTSSQNRGLSCSESILTVLRTTSLNSSSCKTIQMHTKANS